MLKGDLTVTLTCSFIYFAGQMPIHLSVMNGHVHVARLLVRCGANINAKVNILYLLPNTEIVLTVGWKKEIVTIFVFPTGGQIRADSFALRS